ncbi:MAG: methyl-accepting chemotaxis protein [Planctomycetota bacterium]
MKSTFWGPLFSSRNQVFLGLMGWQILFLTSVYWLQSLTSAASFLGTLLIGILGHLGVVYFFHYPREEQLRQISHCLQEMEKGQIPSPDQFSFKKKTESTILGAEKIDSEQKPSFLTDELELLQQHLERFILSYAGQQHLWKEMGGQLTPLFVQIGSLKKNIQEATVGQEKEASIQMETLQMALMRSQEFTLTAKEIVSHAGHAIDVASQASKASREGIAKMRDASGSMEQVKKDVERILQQITNLHEHSQRIYSVISIINEISNQINLLALNASIEAAGAGQAGKRFSVVAKEIRRLATKTSEGTSEIEKMIDAMLELTESSYKASERGKISAETTSVKLSEVMKALNLIYHYVENTDKVSQQISYSIQKQNSISDQINQVISQANTVAIHFLENTQEITLLPVKLEPVLQQCKILLDKLSVPAI